MINKKQPLPKKEQEDNTPAPMYIYWPGISPEVRCLQRKFYDPKGYVSNNGEKKPAEFFVNFYNDAPAMLTKPEYAEKILELYADEGVCQVATIRLPDKVEKFHPEFNSIMKKVTGEKYDESKEVEYVTKRYTFDLNRVIRTGEEYNAGKKRNLREEDYVFDQKDVELIAKDKKAKTIK